MALTANPQTLAKVTVNQAFNATVTITSPPGEVGAPTPVITIGQVTCDLAIPNITITKAGATVTFNGSHSLALFNNNQITYITRGSSDKIESPRQATSFGSLNPATEQVFKYVPDPTTMKIATYSIEAISTLAGVPTTEIVTVTQEVENNYNIGKDTLKGYV